MSTVPPPPPMPDDAPRPSNSLGKTTPAQQGSSIPVNWTPTYEKPIPVGQCVHIKKDGDQCGNWGVRGTIPAMCYKHGAALPSIRKAAETRVAQARVQMQGVAPDMFNVLIELTRPGVEPGIRLKAAQDLLDRAGLKAGQDINLTVEHVGSPLEEINKRMAIMAGRAVDEFGNTEEEPEYEIVDEGEYPQKD